LFRSDLAIAVGGSGASTNMNRFVIELAPVPPTAIARSSPPVPRVMGEENVDDPKGKAEKRISPGCEGRPSRQTRNKLPLSSPMSASRGFPAGAKRLGEKWEPRS